VWIYSANIKMNEWDFETSIPTEGDDQDITSFLVCGNVSPGCPAARVVTLQGFLCGALADAEEKEQGRWRWRWRWR
jgi:hypothetical protein